MFVVLCCALFVDCCVLYTCFFLLFVVCGLLFVVSLNDVCCVLLLLIVDCRAFVVVC